LEFTAGRLCSARFTETHTQGSILAKALPALVTDQLSTTLATVIRTAPTVIYGTTALCAMEDTVNSVDTIQHVFFTSLGTIPRLINHLPLLNQPRRRLETAFAQRLSVYELLGLSILETFGTESGFAYRTVHERCNRRILGLIDDSLAILALVCIAVFNGPRLFVLPLHKQRLSLFAHRVVCVRVEFIPLSALHENISGFHTELTSGTAINQTVINLIFFPTFRAGKDLV
jgi:hypothetical protein